MPDPILIDKNLLLSAEYTPAAVTWNRLEGRPRKEDFSRSLRAEVRDPLWMLCRQWQFGEFRADNTGSAVKVRLQMDSASLDSYAPAEGDTQPHDDTMPLEVRVEREAVPMSLAARVQAGRQFVRLARGAYDATVRARYLERYPIEASVDPEKAAQLASDVAAFAWFSAVAGRIPDGATLLAQIADGQHDSFVAGLPVAESVRDALRTAATALRRWFAALYSAPAANERGAWQPSRLEYKFRCGVPASSAGEAQHTVLAADGYAGGTLDWHAFDVDPSDTIAGTGAAVSEGPVSFLPAPIKFGGMPNMRWWQFEDRKTSFGGIRASTTDLSLLMIAELALVYGNDWLLAPYDLPAGSLTRIGGILVTDVFGVRTFVRAAGSRPQDSWQQWNLFNPHVPGARGEASLLLMGTVGHRQDGSPIESVTLNRDEMANMVFAIEETIPGEVGHGIGGAEAARALERHLRAATPAPPPASDTDARIRYVAGTTVPENWIPFLPVQISATSGDVRLQRGRMARTMPNAPSPTVAPRGDILRQGLDRTPPEPYYIEEEEVPNSGVRVTRAFQRTRWYDGRVLVWLGRCKTVDRHEGRSGLEFDQVQNRRPIPDA